MATNKCFFFNLLEEATYNLVEDQLARSVLREIQEKQAELGS